MKEKMSYPENFDAEGQRQELLGMIDNAIGADVDVLADSGTGFVAVMGKKANMDIRQDVPAAFEMYTLLSHFMKTLPFHVSELGKADTVLSPSVHFDKANGRVVALIPIGAKELELVSFWLSEGLRSNTVKAMAGMLALPFSVEVHEDRSHLIPEWFAAFYVNGSEDHCVPMLALRSVTMDERFGDWVAIALERMQVFGLPCASAQNAIDQKTAH
jgi:hypothetical protein